MGNFDIDVTLFPRFGLVLLELQVTFRGFRVETHPTLELVVCTHGFDVVKESVTESNFFELKIEML